MDTAKAIQRLDQLIRKGEAVLQARDSRGSKSLSWGKPSLQSGPFTEWQTQSMVFLASLCGDKSAYVKDYMEDVRQGLPSHINKGLSILKALREELALGIYLYSDKDESTEAQSDGRTLPTTRQVLLLHGYDDEMTQQVAETLSQLGLAPVIFPELPGASNVLAEKPEISADLGFAVVLLSPDDKGFSANEKPKRARPRPRQDIIFQLGYFIGTLGRARVFALMRGENLELPSDFGGIRHTRFDQDGEWRYTMVRKLKAAGYSVDASKLF